jgi:GntR family transcriptional repressor for pyruvate dehydrogenase complex
MAEIDSQAMDDSGRSTSSGSTLADKAYIDIVDSISHGEFGPGSKLPSEAELAERFGVSRPTMREALFRLRSDGIVTSRRGSRSYVVRAPDMTVRRLALVESIDDIQRYYAFRMCVESGAAGLAAEMHTAQDLAAIRAAYRNLAEAQQAEAPCVEEDIRFHLAIAAASHNQFFVSTIEFIVGPIRQCMELAHNLFPTKRRGRTSQVQTEHQAIIEGIAKRSPEEASEAMRQHISNARRRIFEGA